MLVVPFHKSLMLHFSKGDIYGCVGVVYAARLVYSRWNGGKMDRKRDTSKKVAIMLTRVDANTRGRRLDLTYKCMLSNIAPLPLGPLLSDTVLSITYYTQYSLVPGIYIDRSLRVPTTSIVFSGRHLLCKTHRTVQGRKKNCDTVLKN